MSHFLSRAIEALRVQNDYELSHKNNLHQSAAIRDANLVVLRMAGRSGRKANFSVEMIYMENAPYNKTKILGGTK